MKIIVRELRRHKIITVIVMVCTPENYVALFFFALFFLLCFFAADDFSEDVTY